MSTDAWRNALDNLKKKPMPRIGFTQEDIDFIFPKILEAEANLKDGKVFTKDDMVLTWDKPLTWDGVEMTPEKPDT